MNNILPAFYFPQYGGDDDLQSLLATSSVVNPPLNALVVFFVLLIFGGHIGIPAILITLRVKRLKRHPMLKNFLVTWIIYSTSFCMLLYLGKQFSSESDIGLCTVQASLIYGTAVLTPASGFCFVLYLWFVLRDLTQQESEHRLRDYSLIVAPYVVFCVFIIFAALYGSLNPGLISRFHYGFYCTLNSRIVDVVPATAAVILFLVILFEGLVAFKLYRMRKSYRTMNSNGGAPTHLVIRVGIFSCYSFLAIIGSIAFWAKSGSTLPYIIQASLPTAAFVIFGTQRDLLEAWGVIGIFDVLRGKPKLVEMAEVPPQSRF